MNTEKKLFEILALLGASDGQMNYSEGFVIEDFVKENYGEEFSVEEIYEFIQGLSGADVLHRFSKLVLETKSELDEKKRDQALSYALKLIMADKKVDPAEKKLFQILCAQWGVDMKAFLESQKGEG